jgi:polyphosphate kinase
VRVGLIVRLLPPAPGVRVLETIRVVSIVGRFLEHAVYSSQRRGGGILHRLGRRDEAQPRVPGQKSGRSAPALRAELKTLLDVQWGDRRSAWEMRPDGTYVQRRPAGKKGPPETGSQEVLIRLAEKRQKTATRLRKRTALTPGKRNLR